MTAEPTQAVSQSAYRKLTKSARDHAATLSAARRDGLAKIASSGRNIFTRENAIGAYCDARFWAKQSATKLAAVHPEKAPNWSPNARRRHGYTEDTERTKLEEG